MTWVERHLFLSDRVTLFAKAAAELLDRGQSVEAANRQLQELWDLLEALL